MAGGWLAGEVGTSKKSLVCHLASPDCLIVSLPFQLTVEPSLAQNYPRSLEKQKVGRRTWKICSRPSQQKQEKLCKYQPSGKYSQIQSFNCLCWTSSLPSGFYRLMSDCQL